MIPHVPRGYDHIVGKLKERFEAVRQEQAEPAKEKPDGK